MTAREKFTNLLRKLLQATKMRRVVWSDTADENTFRLTFDNGMIHIGEAPNPVFPSKLLTATLFNQNNTPIETIKSGDDVPSEEGNLLRELYALARESALRPDDVLESVEAELEQRMRKPPPPTGPRNVTVKQID
jgi:hypothetical protein